jgi:hypothetical protein
MGKCKVLLARMMIRNVDGLLAWKMAGRPFACLGRVMGKGMVCLLA